MITTVTLNPSFDVSLHVSTLLHGRVNRSSGEEVEAGGKGVNVTRALDNNDVPSEAVVVLGARDAERYRSMLDLDERLRTIEVPGAIRTNISIVEPTGVVTKVNTLGSEDRAVDVDAVVAKVATAADGSDWTTLCGSLPPWAPRDLYARLVDEVRSTGAKVALDTGGRHLAETVPAGPDVVKPNLWELHRATGVELASHEDVATAARILIDRGAGRVVCSLGRDGAMLVTEDDVFLASTEPFPVRSDVGAGDALLAGFLASDGPPGASLRRAVQWGTAACRLPGCRMPVPGDVASVPVTVARNPESRALSDRGALQEAAP